MGAALCLPASDDAIAAPPPARVIVDLLGRVVRFGCPVPKPEEMPIVRALADILSRSTELLESVRSYPGCSEAIRAAVGRPSQQTEEAVWRELEPAIMQLRAFYDYAQTLVTAIPIVLRFFASSTNIQESIERYQASTKKLADVLFFAHLFDEAKMMNSNFQNDLSYYRRALQKARMNGQKPSGGRGPRMLIADDVANSMSMFYANPSPMLTTLIDGCKKIPASMPTENSAEFLSLLAAGCFNIISKQQMGNRSMVEYCLRVMVMCIVIYDHVNPGGVFAKGTAVDVRAYVNLITVYGGDIQAELLNGIRYSTIHFKDDNTPKKIQQMLTE
ncbi:Protein fam49a [Entophlyctis sp. JEL0112]|nr:Protein fam49a [Entophlyctis sp. JEL0112]